MVVQLTKIRNEHNSVTKVGATRGIDVRGDGPKATFRVAAARSGSGPWWGS